MVSKPLESVHHPNLGLLSTSTMARSCVILSNEDEPNESTQDKRNKRSSKHKKKTRKSNKKIKKAARKKKGNTTKGDRKDKRLRGKR